jgi:hypothetical protein
LQGIPTSLSRNRLHQQQANTAGALRRQETIELAFKPARKLLLNAGVPFDPNALLDPKWRENLAATFAKMMEMQRDRTVTSNRLSGIYMANKLTLPEKTKGNGDIIILARHLVFDGENVEIIAPGRSVSIYVIESVKGRIERGCH